MRVKHVACQSVVQIRLLKLCLFTWLQGQEVFNITEHKEFLGYQQHVIFGLECFSEYLSAGGLYYTLQIKKVRNTFSRK